MARPRKQQALDGIRERRVVAGNGASKEGQLQDEAARLAARFGLTATEPEPGPTPSEEAELEAAAARPRILAPNGRAAQPGHDDAVLAAAERIITARKKAAEALPEPAGPKKNEVLAIAGGAFNSLVDLGIKQDVAATLTLAYAMLEAANVLASWRDKRG